VVRNARGLFARREENCRRSAPKRRKALALSRESLSQTSIAYRPNLIGAFYYLTIGVFNGLTLPIFDPFFTALFFAIFFSLNLKLPSRAMPN
jgi:hypothetical protein